QRRLLRFSGGPTARHRRDAGRQPLPRQGPYPPLPLARSPPGSFKRLLGAGLRPPTDRDERLLLETARTGADPDCRGIRGNARRLLAPDVLSGQNSRKLLASDVLGGQNSRLPAPAVYLTPLEFNVCQVR